MIRRLAIGLAITSLALVCPRAFAAPTGDVYDTVDSVEVHNFNTDVGSGTNVTLTVTGIRAGAAAPVTKVYSFGTVSQYALDAVHQCQRLAVLAMSKPGKFRFSVNTPYSYAPSFAVGCAMTVRTP